MSNASRTSVARERATTQPASHARRELDARRRRQRTSRRSARAPGGRGGCESATTRAASRSPCCAASTWKSAAASSCRSSARAARARARCCTCWARSTRPTPAKSCFDGRRIDNLPAAPARPAAQQALRHDLSVLSPAAGAERAGKRAGAADDRRGRLELFSPPPPARRTGHGNCSTWSGCRTG